MLSHRLISSSIKVYGPRWNWRLLFDHSATSDNILNLWCINCLSMWSQNKRSLNTITGKVISLDVGIQTRVMLGVEMTCT